MEPEHKQLIILAKGPPKAMAKRVIVMEHSGGSRDLQGTEVILKSSSEIRLRLKTYHSNR